MQELRNQLQIQGKVAGESVSGNRCGVEPEDSGMNEIYAEWTKGCVFDNGFFSTWDAYHDFFFDPSIEVKFVREIR